VIHIPGHTLGHVAFYANPVLFSGDTLFGAGCGRIFEGTAEEMLCSLNKLMALPDETLIYCGHEYTLANLNFALHVEPENEDIQQCIKLTEKLLLNNNTSLPSTMSSEKKINPFLRCVQKSIIERVQIYANRKLTNTTDVFRELREWKNKF
jgi:hydroxyacylglutathione hydrolase